MKTLKRLFLAIAVVAVAVGCTAEQEQQTPKNVIYLIGDGMGFGAVSSLLLAEDGDTGFEMNPVIGLNETQSANNYVTDSPAGGTALATGSHLLNSMLFYH